MAFNSIPDFLSQPYDCLILVHPQIHVLEMVSNQIQGLGFAFLNVSKELSASLMCISVSEHSRFSQKWLVDSLASFAHGPVLLTCPDLLFDPKLSIDPLTLFRQAARLSQLIVLWPGEYSANTLAYAIPEHHHFRTWKVSDALLRQPVVVIQQISTSQGA
jgi:hypothetical protein